MPKKDSLSTSDTKHLTVEDKLDFIIMYLERMDKRDRLRTWGGFIRGLLGLIPLAIMLASVWYLINHGDEFLQKITEQAARQAMQVTGEAAGSMQIDPGLLKQLMGQ